MNTKQVAVITSISGTQSYAIAKSFAEAGYHIRGLSRKPVNATPFETRIVDPTDVDDMTKALENADVVAFTSPIDYKPGVREQLAETLVQASERAGVNRIVSNAAAAVLEGYDRPVSIDMRRIREIILSAQIEAVAVQPTVYMDNLIEPWAKPSIVNDGVLAYPMHPEARVSWLSHDSLGAFMVAAASVPLNTGKIYNVGGPEALTGSEVAAILSQVVGRDVAYHFVPPKEFAKGLNQVFGEPVGDHIGDLYTYVETNLNALNRQPSEYEPLGVKPERFVDWAKRQSWRL